MAAGTVTITGTLVNPAGTAQASQVVTAYRLQDKATAVALTASSVGTADKFTATTNGSGVFSIACTHLTAHVAPLTYKIVFPDNRYCLQQVTVYDNGKTIELDDAKITKTDVTASNGIIQVIDRVLQP